MQAQDGWIVRIRPHCASLNVAQWRALAELALAHAHPQLELTRLGNIQLRGVHASQLGQVRSQLVAAGLVPANADEDLAPAVHCSPLYARHDLTHQLAQSLSHAAATRLSPHALQTLGLNALPSKFGLLVDDEQQSLRDIGADLRLHVLPASAQTEHFAPRYALTLGSSGKNYVYGSATEAIEAAVQIAIWFAGERVRGDQQGDRQAITRLQQKLAYLPQDLPALRTATVLETSPDASATCPLTPGEHGRHFVLGAPLGRVNAQAVLLLASHLPPNTEIRVTPWRSLLVADGATTIAPKALDSASWIVESRDARSRVSACTGSPGCTQALMPAQQLALQSAKHLPEGMHLHISGCAKLCALGKEATAVVYASQSDAAQLLLNAYTAAQPQARIQIPFQAQLSEPAQIQELIHELSI